MVDLENHVVDLENRMVEQYGWTRMIVAASRNDDVTRLSRSTTWFSRSTTGYIATILLTVTQTEVAVYENGQYWQTQCIYLLLWISQMFGSELVRDKLNSSHYFELYHSGRSHVSNTSLIPPNKRIIFIHYIQRPIKAKYTHMHNKYRILII